MSSESKVPHPADELKKFVDPDANVEVGDSNAELHEGLLGGYNQPRKSKSLGEIHHSVEIGSKVYALKKDGGYLLVPRSKGELFDSVFDAHKISYKEQDTDLGAVKQNGEFIPPAGVPSDAFIPPSKAFVMRFYDRFGYFQGSNWIRCSERVTVVSRQLNEVMYPWFRPSRAHGNVINEYIPTQSIGSFKILDYNGCPSFGYEWSSQDSWNTCKTIGYFCVWPFLFLLRAGWELWRWSNPLYLLWCFAFLSFGLSFGSMDTFNPRYMFAATFFGISSVFISIYAIGWVRDEERHGIRLGGEPGAFEKASFDPIKGNPKHKVAREKSRFNDRLLHGSRLVLLLISIAALSSVVVDAQFSRDRGEIGGWFHRCDGYIGNGRFEEIDEESEEGCEELVKCTEAVITHGFASHVCDTSIRYSVYVSVLFNFLALLILSYLIAIMIYLDLSVPHKIWYSEVYLQGTPGAFVTLETEDARDLQNYLSIMFAKHWNEKLPTPSLTPGQQSQREAIAGLKEFEKVVSAVPH